MNPNQLRIRLLRFGALALVMLTGCSHRTPDLTQASAETFAANVGNTVSLEGRLSTGKLGYSLWNATPEHVTFYVIPEIPAEGAFAGSWHLLEHQVRVTGKLKFSPAADPPNRDPTMASGPSNYYYMVLQETKIERIDKGANESAARFERLPPPAPKGEDNPFK